MFLLMKKQKDAILAFEILRDIAYEMDDKNKKMEAYKCLGKAYQDDKKYYESMMCYKLILLYSWVGNHKKWEHMAYSNLAT